MPSEYQLSTAHEAGWALIACLVTSLGYFAASHRTRMPLRIATASPGLIVLVAFGFALAVSPLTDARSVVALWIFNGLMLLALAADFAAIYAFEGKEWIHFLQLLFVPCLPWIWLVGGIAITHDGP